MTLGFGIGMFFYGMGAICIGATIAYYIINKIQKTPAEIEQEENEKYLTFVLYPISHITISQS